MPEKRRLSHFYTQYYYILITKELQVFLFCYMFFCNMRHFTHMCFSDILISELKYIE